MGKQYNSYCICKRCENTFGEHRWIDNACPTKKGKIYSDVYYTGNEQDKKPVFIFHLFKRFKPK